MTTQSPPLTIDVTGVPLAVDLDPPARLTLELTPEDVERLVRAGALRRPVRLLFTPSEV